jgi:hypothetical protein
MTTTENPAAPLPFMLPAANLAVGDVVADSEDNYKGGTVAAVTGRGGPDLVEVVWTDHSRGAFTADCLVVVTRRHAVQ